MFIGMTAGRKSSEFFLKGGGECKKRSGRTTCTNGFLRKRFEMSEDL